MSEHVVLQHDTRLRELDDALEPCSGERGGLPGERSVNPAAGAGVKRIGGGAIGAEIQGGLECEGRGGQSQLDDGVGGFGSSGELFAA